MWLLRMRAMATQLQCNMSKRRLLSTCLALFSMLPVFILNQWGKKRWEYQRGFELDKWNANLRWNSYTRQCLRICLLAPPGFILRAPGEKMPPNDQNPWLDTTVLAAWRTRNRECPPKNNANLRKSYAAGRWNVFIKSCAKYRWKWGMQHVWG